MQNKTLKYVRLWEKNKGVKFGWWQEKGVEYLTRNEFGGALFMEPRTGKSATSLIALINRYFELHIKMFPLLIVTTKSVLRAWPKELESMGIKDYTIVTGSKQKKEQTVTKDCKIMIATYDAMTGYDLLMKKPWQNIILDESLQIASMNTSRTKYVLKCIDRLDRKAHKPFVVVLNGEPAPESPIQYLPQYMSSLRHFMWHVTPYSYLREYWNYSSFSHKWLPKKRKHLEEIRTYVNETAYKITMGETGCGSPKHRATFDLNVSDEQLALIEQCKVKKEKLNDLARAMGLEPGIGNMVYVYYENAVCAGIDPITKEIFDTRKIDTIIEYVKEHKEPVIVFSPYVRVLQCGKERALANGLVSEMLFGESKDAFRESTREKFQEGQIDIAWIQVKVGKVGMDWSRACTTFYHSNSFSLDDRKQSENRTTRLDKSRTVNIFDFRTLYQGQAMMDGVVKDKLIAKEKLSSKLLMKACTITK